MIISLIVAASENGAIGKDNALLWHISSDLKHFKSLTSNKTVIMGRLTYESIGRALPNRRNIIISRNANYQAPNCEIATSIEDAIKLAGTEDEIFIIGGGSIYKTMWNKADRLYLTEVHTSIEDADTFIPEISSGYWQETERTRHKASNKDDFDFSYVNYTKSTI